MPLFRHGMRPDDLSKATSLGQCVVINSCVIKCWSFGKEILMELMKTCFGSLSFKSDM